MKNARVTSTGGVLQNKCVDELYPVQNVETTLTTTWKQLCAHLRASTDIHVLLEQYRNLDEQSADVTRVFAWVYRYKRGLSRLDVLRGHGEYYAAWYDGADLASIQEYLVEQECVS